MKNPPAKKYKILDNAKADPASCYWRNKADVAWRKKILALDRGVCAVCGKTGKWLNVHHLFDRYRLDTRYKVCNGITLCSAHHKHDRSCSAHGGPVGFFIWLMLVRPGVWDWLKANAKAPDIYIPNFKAAYEALIA